MASNGDKRDGATLVLVRSSPIRRKLVQQLREQGEEAKPVVSWTQALHYMKREAVPSSMIVTSRLQNEIDGITFVKGLASVEKTSHLPAVLVLSTAGAFETVRSVELPAHVVPVVEFESDDTLATAILEAREKAIEIAETSTVATFAPEFDGVEVEAIRALDRAFLSVRQVIQRVVKDQLPGPVMPEMLREARQLFTNPTVSIGDIEQFTAKHQTLAARLMRLTNSAYYSRGSRVSSLRYAITRLGLKTASSVLQALATQEFVVGKDPMMRELIQSNLRYAQLVGLVCERLALNGTDLDPLNAYAIGLFHNIGATFYIYTLSLLKDEGRIGALEPDAILTAARARASELNEVVVQAMKLPDEVALIFSDDVSEAEDTDYIGITHKAMWIADRVIDGGATVLELDPEAEMLGFTESQLADVSEQLGPMLSVLDA